MELFEDTDYGLVLEYEEGNATPMLTKAEADEDGDDTVANPVVQERPLRNNEQYSPVR